MNEIVIDFANPGSITIEFLAKVPGPELTLGQSTMVFSHSDSFARANALEGYERLILARHERRPGAIHQVRRDRVAEIAA